MSTINSYSDLQAAIGRWLARPDLSTSFPDWISIFEQSASRRLQVRQQETIAVLTPAPITAASSGAPLPVDFLQARRVTWNGNAATGTTMVTLEYVTPDYMRYRFPVSNNSVGIPQVYTIEGPNLLVPTLDPTPIEMNYLAMIPALDDPANAGVNWLLASYPDLYLFGSLCEAQGFVIDLEKSAYWKARRDEIFDEVIRLNGLSRGIGGMRVMGPTP